MSKSGVLGISRNHGIVRSMESLPKRSHITFESPLRSRKPGLQNNEQYGSLPDLVVSHSRGSSAISRRELPHGSNVFEDVMKEFNHLSVSQESFHKRGLMRGGEQDSDTASDASDISGFVSKDAETICSRTLLTYFPRHMKSPTFSQSLPNSPNTRRRRVTVSDAPARSHERLGRATPDRSRTFSDSIDHIASPQTARRRKAVSTITPPTFRRNLKI